jgi:hypothetical protein
MCQGKKTLIFHLVALYSLAHPLPTYLLFLRLADPGLWCVTMLALIMSAASPDNWYCNLKEHPTLGEL